MGSAVERYEELEQSYLPNDNGEDHVIHVYIAAVDFQLRFVTMCTAARLRELDPDQIRLQRSPGFGAFQAYLTHAASFLRNSVQSSLADPTLELIRALLDEIQKGNGQDQQFGTLKKLRDHLFHGNPMPTGEAGHIATLRVKSTAIAISGLIRQYLANAEISTISDSSGLNRLEFHWTGKQLDTWPFICVDDAGRLCVLSTFNDMSPVYLRSDQRDVRVKASGDDLVLALSQSMRPPTEDRTFPNLMGDLRADLNGFRDVDHALHPYDMDTEVTVYWVRALSTGAEHRTDRFRIGDSEQRQWWDSDNKIWVPYPDFLRYIANWPVVARRVRQYLTNIESELVASERKVLGWSKPSGDLITPKVKVTGLQESDSDQFMSFDELRQDIDDRLGIRASRTRIYFVSGEAGIGKTRTLVNAALSRAKEIENEEEKVVSHKRLPLFYYVRSTGQNSNSLNTVIEAAGAKTQNLTLENIRALCRNGLVALFIDGFDELLGGVGYENALGSLKVWIDAMNGRGAIVVSARSSYYLNQYTASLLREQQRQVMLVQHRVATVQRWQDWQVEAFLEQNEVDPTVREDLSDDDKSLLGLPFFARVYVESINSGETHVDSLPDLVLQQYLKRESSKLIMSGDQKSPLLDQAELHATFESLARLMAEEGARVLELEDLELAVSDALGEDDLDVRPGLKRRLSVLCGLEVTEGVGSKKLFSFQHELFYDIFLADAMLRDLKDENFGPVVTMLGKAQMRVATISRLVQLAPRTIEQLLKTNVKKVENLPIARQEAYAANLGLMWAILVRQTNALERVKIAGLSFEELDLTKAKVESVSFTDCRFENLKLPAVEARKISFASCSIDTLWVEHDNLPLRGISSFDETSVALLVRQGYLVEKPQKIQEALRELGAPVPSTKPENEKNQFTEAVEFLLQNFSQRVDSVVVYERDLRPADENPRWQMEFGSNAWTTFVKLLNESGAGRLVAIPASGASVLRVRIQSIEQLRNRDVGDNPAVATFWDRVESQNIRNT
jgi:hypothetical protein